MASPVKINAVANCTFALVGFSSRHIDLKVIGSTDHLLLPPGKGIYSYATLFGKCMTGKSKSVKIFIHNDVLHFEGSFTYARRWKLWCWSPSA